MATHSSVLAWRIPGTGEPGGLPSMGSDRVRQTEQLSNSAIVSSLQSCIGFVVHFPCEPLACVAEKCLNQTLTLPLSLLISSATPWLAPTLLFVLLPPSSRLQAALFLSRSAVTSRPAFPLCLCHSGSPPAAGPPSTPAPGRGRPDAACGPAVGASFVATQCWHLFPPSVGFPL